MLRTLVVDDEKPARDDLIWMLRRESEIGDIEQACGGAEAMKLLTHSESAFDVVFLDMKMPDLDGLDIARMIDRFEQPPAIVFVTAFDTPASDAFDLGVVDYLRKPVATDRLSRAVQRVANLRQAPGEIAAVDVKAARLAVAGSNGRQILLRPDEVTHFQASGDYVRVFTTDESYLIRETMARLTDGWSRFGFVRVHRGFSVRLDVIDELRSSSSGRCAMVGGHELPISRRYFRELTARLHGDNGAEGPL